MVKSVVSSVSSRFSGLQIMAAAVVVCVMALVSFGTFYYSSFQRIEREMRMPIPQTPQIVSLMQEMRRELGHGGFLLYLNEFIQTRDPLSVSAMDAPLLKATRTFSTMRELDNSAEHAALMDEISVILSNFQQVRTKADDISRYGTADIDPTLGLVAMSALNALSARIDQLQKDSEVAQQTESVFLVNQLEMMTRRSHQLMLGAVVLCLLTLGLGGVMVVRHMSAPVRRLKQMAESLSQGNLDAGHWGLDRQDEVGDLARALEQFRVRLKQSQDSERAALIEVERLKADPETIQMVKSLSDSVHSIGHVSTHLTGLVNETRSGLLSSISDVQGACNGIAGNVEAAVTRVNEATDQLTTVSFYLSDADQGVIGRLQGSVDGLTGRIDELADMAASASDNITVSLESLTSAEGDVRSAAAGARESAAQLQATADDVWGRLDQAIGQMQDSSKDVSETSADVRKSLQAGAAAISEDQSALHEAVTGASTMLKAAVESVSYSADILSDKSRETYQSIQDAASQLGDVTKKLTDHSQYAGTHMDRLGDASMQLTSHVKQIGEDAQRTSHAIDTIENLRKHGRMIEEVASEIVGHREDVKKAAEMSKGLRQDMKAVADTAEMLDEIPGRFRRVLSDIMQHEGETRDSIKQVMEKFQSVITHTGDALNASVGSAQKIHGRMEKMIDDLTRRTHLIEQELVEIDKGSKTSSRIEKSVQDLDARISKMNDDIRDVETHFTKTSDKMNKIFIELGTAITHLAGKTGGSVDLGGLQENVSKLQDKTDDLFKLLAGRVDEIAGALRHSGPTPTIDGVAKLRLVGNDEKITNLKDAEARLENLSKFVDDLAGQTTHLARDVVTKSSAGLDGKSYRPPTALDSFDPKTREMIDTILATVQQLNDVATSIAVIGDAGHTSGSRSSVTGA